MSELSLCQIEFLAEHHIPFSQLFDAHGNSVRSCRDIMRVQDKLFAYGVVSCKRGHDSIRSRAGHCLQCNHATIQYMSRNSAPGHVYVAVSRNEKFIKIGCTSDIGVRSSQIRNEMYAGISDWVVLLSMASPQAGKLEFAIQSKLIEYSSQAKNYQKSGMTQRAREVFEVE